VKQSRIMSLVESITNVVVGYVLAIATQLAVFPLFGIEAALGEHLAIGVAFVGVSLVRGYLLRRLFERIRLREFPCARQCRRIGRHDDSAPGGPTASTTTLRAIRRHEKQERQ